MNKILLSSLIIMTSSLINAQNTNVIWQKTIGGDSFERFSNLVLTDDDGYLLAGNSSSDISGNKTQNTLGTSDFWIVKLDADRNIEWQQVYGGDNAEFLISALATSDNAFLLFGSSNSGISGNKSTESFGADDLWVVKIDNAGNILWDLSYGGINSDQLNSVTATSDGGFLILSNSFSGISGNKTVEGKGWIIKIDIDGNIEWQNNIEDPNSDYEFGGSIKETSDGGFVAASNFLDFLQGDFAFTNINISKYDNNQNFEFSVLISGTDNDRIDDLIIDNDGNYLLIATSDSDIGEDKTEDSIGSRDYWIIKLDQNGTIIWQNTIGGNQLDTSAKGLLDGNILNVIGSSASGISGDKTTENGGSRDIWITYINIETGEILGDQSLLADDWDDGIDIHMANDGNLIIGANSNSGISIDKTEDSYGDFDYWLLKVEPAVLGLVDNQLSSILFHPNPIKDKLKISLGRNYNNILVKLYTIEGKEVFTRNYFNTDIIDLNLTLDSGMYALSVIADNTNLKTAKLIKQ